MDVVLTLEGADFFDQGCVSGMRRKALSRERRVRIGQIEPTAVLGRVIPLEAVDQSSRFGHEVRRLAWPQ